MVESTGSSGIPPKKIPQSTQQNASTSNTNAPNNTPVNAQRPAPQKPGNKESTGTSAKDPSIVSNQAEQGIKAMTAGQVNTAQRTENIKKLISEAIKDPKKGVSDSTFSGLLNAAKNHSKTGGGRFDPAEPDDDLGFENEELEGLTPDLEAALRMAFSR
jgi:hypothetical protein